MPLEKDQAFGYFTEDVKVESSSRETERDSVEWDSPVYAGPYVGVIEPAQEVGERYFPRYRWPFVRLDASEEWEMSYWSENWTPFK